MKMTNYSLMDRAAVACPLASGEDSLCHRFRAIDVGGPLPWLRVHIWVG